MTTEHDTAATSSVREPAQRIGLAWRRAQQHLADTCELIRALHILRAQEPEAAQHALDKIKKFAEDVARRAGPTTHIERRPRP